jgi:hypothetical protein
MNVPPRKALIVVAGMRHCGSTALFNILRLGLTQDRRPFVSGYSEHEKTASLMQRTDRLRLIKTHEFRDDIAASADFIFTARRDLRDTVASAARRDFPLYSQLKSPVEYAKYNRMLHDMWAAHSNYEFVYEDFMTNPLQVISSVLRAAGLRVNMAKSIHKKILALPRNDYRRTLLTQQHITDPERCLSYAATLKPDDIAKIEAQHFAWLAHHNYATGRSGAA